MLFEVILHLSYYSGLIGLTSFGYGRLMSFFKVFVKENYSFSDKLNAIQTCIPNLRNYVTRPVGDILLAGFVLSGCCVTRGCAGFFGAW